MNFKLGYAAFTDALACTAGRISVVHEPRVLVGDGVVLDPALAADVGVAARLLRHDDERRQAAAGVGIDGEIVERVLDERQLVDAEPGAGPGGGPVVKNEQRRGRAVLVLGGDVNRYLSSGDGRLVGVEGRILPRVERALRHRHRELEQPALGIAVVHELGLRGVGGADGGVAVARVAGIGQRCKSARAAGASAIVAAGRTGSAARAARSDRPAASPSGRPRRAAAAAIRARSAVARRATTRNAAASRAPGRAAATGHSGEGAAQTGACPVGPGVISGAARCPGASRARGRPAGPRRAGGEEQRHEAQETAARRASSQEAAPPSAPSRSTKRLRARASDKVCPESRRPIGQTADLSRAAPCAVCASPRTSCTTLPHGPRQATERFRAACLLLRRLVGHRTRGTRMNRDGRGNGNRRWVAGLAIAGACVGTVSCGDNRSSAAASDEGGRSPRSWPTATVVASHHRRRYLPAPHRQAGTVRAATARATRWRPGGSTTAAVDRPSSPTRRSTIHRTRRSGPSAWPVLRRWTAKESSWPDPTTSCTHPTRPTSTSATV